MSKNLHIIGAAIAVSTGTFGANEGPKKIQANSALKAAINRPVTWEVTIEEKADIFGLAAIPVVARACEKIAEYTSRLTRENKPFITIGGDHSCAIGTWSGAAHALRDEGDLGLIWIDAHMDSHTPESSDSGNIHGMPVASLLGYGDARLTEIGDALPKIKPENICLIGVRDYEPAERELLEKLGVRIFYIEEVNERGLKTIMQEAIDIATKNTARFGITIDLDGLDPADAPAVDLPIENGVRADELLATFDDIKQHKNFIGAEIAELNPRLDGEGKTERVVYKLINGLF